MSTDLAYVAGFVDGEGCFQIAKNGGVSLSIINTSLVVLEYIQATLGKGSIRPRKQSVNKPQYVFRVYGDDCVEVIQEIAPFLIEKLEEALLVITYRAAVRPLRSPGVRGAFHNPDHEIYRDVLARLKKEKQCQTPLQLTSPQ